MTKEPVLILAAVAAVGQLIVGIATNHLDTTILTAVITSVTALLQRSKVSPVQRATPTFDT